MIRLFIYTFVIFSLAACNNAQSDFFRLEGTVEGAEEHDNISLYYSVLENDEWYKVSATTEIIDGKFFFEGNIEGLTAADLCFDDGNVVVDVRIYLEPTTMILRIDKSQLYAYELSGTKIEKENIELRKVLEADEKIIHENLKSVDNLVNQIGLYSENDLIRDSLVNNLSLFVAKNIFLIQKMNNARLDFISKHNTYQIAPDLLYLVANRNDSIPIETIRDIYNNLPEKSKAGLMGKLACKQIEYRESKKNTSVGDLAPDFTRKTFSGETISLSDFKNNDYVLLDFWANWCAPCLKEIPNIKKLHNKYGKKEFKIISISLDDDRNNWIEGINKHQIDTWHQVLSEENNNNALFKDDISLLYNVEIIPHFILIDKQGKIIARGEYLDEKLLNEIDRLLN